jgi:hypothetical protein
VLALDRAILAFLKRHHVPLDAALIAGGGLAVFVLSLTISTYQQFYFSSHGWLPGVGVALALLAGMVAATASRRAGLAGAGEDRVMAVMARVALVGAVLVLQLAPMQLSAA